jgi:hypothetical protein
MKWAILLLALALGACASEAHPLALVSPDDPTWPLNPGQWGATGNDIDHAPVNSPVFSNAVGM